MKKIFFVPILLLFFACSKDKQASSSSVIAPQDFFSYLKAKITEEPDALISVIAISYPNSPDIKTHINLAASVNYESNKNFMNEVSFGGYKLSKTLDPTNNRAYFRSDLEGDILFGRKVQVNLKADNFELNTNFELPKIAELDVHSTDISKSKGYTFYWNKESDNNIPVQIKLRYNEFASRFAYKNGNFPKEEIQLTKFVQDEGQYTITPDELSRFPLGSIVEISISRGSFSYLNSNGKNILIYCISNNTIPVTTIVD